MNKLPRHTIIPSSVITVPTTRLNHYISVGKKPEMGDLVYGEVMSVSAHAGIENRFGRVHNLHNHSKAIFVFANRYSPDYFEGVVPEAYTEQIDLISLAGVIGRMTVKNTNKQDPTQIKILGYVCDKNGKIVNTRDHSLIVPKSKFKKFPRSKCIVVVGTAMSSGKSRAAVELCRILCMLGKKVCAAKITGTARLKDILFMNDGGASPVVDFTYLGYPSTYLLSEHELLEIFNNIDLKYANNPKSYFVVEIADGILQRETAILLKSEEFIKRIDKLVFCAKDSVGVAGGVQILKDKFDMTPDLLSGIFSSTPLYAREIAEISRIPFFDSLNADVEVITKALGIQKYQVPDNSETLLKAI